MEFEKRLLAKSIATTILEGFNRHFKIFQEISKGAKSRFEQADWAAVQEMARERVGVYDIRVNETCDILRKEYPVSDMDRELWEHAKRSYSRLLIDHSQPELAETFYTSVFCRVFSKAYYTNQFIYLRSSVSTEFLPEPSGEKRAYLSYYPQKGQLKQLLRQIIAAQEFSIPFEDLERDISRCIRRFLAHYGKPVMRVGVLNSQIQLICRPFYRNKGAYLVGKILYGQNVYPFALALLRNPDGALYVDNLLLGGMQISPVFSHFQAYFMNEHQVPSAIVTFLREILPGRTVSELYSAIGLHKHAKTDFYRHFLHHLSHSSDRFVIAPGIRGMVMMVFTLPSYNYVFKIIKDKFAPQKDFSRRQVEEKYQLVKRHDRVGRMADMLEYSDVSLPLNRFDHALLEEIQDTCESSLRIEGDDLILRHVYIERRLTPLNMYMEHASDEELEEAVIDYGQAIKQLAAANIFPGDFLYKNFGITRFNRIVFYDYDEISYMTECNFRKIPPPRYPEDRFSSTPWYSIEPNDVFPEEFASFLLNNPKVRKTFMTHHKDLLDAKWWNEKKSNIQVGHYEDVYPYDESTRFHITYEK